MTGAVISLAIKQPALALPLAFASHFLLDSLPHFGYPGHLGLGEALKHRITFVVLVLDSMALPIITFILIRNSAWLACVGALAAISPDFIWIYRFLVTEKRGK